MGAICRWVLIALAAAVVVAPPASLAGTPQLVRDINTNVVPPSSKPYRLGRLGGKVLFAADDDASPGLWSTDGTEAGTVLIKRFPSQIDCRSFGAPIDCVVQMGGRAYFGADDGLTGEELWSTDGTSAGTQLVIDLAPGADSSSARPVAVLSDRLIFTARDPATLHGDYYITDGTSSGTRAITQFHHELGEGIGPLLAVVGNKFYFGAIVATPSPGTRQTIFVSDGTAAGTHEVNNPSGAFAGASSVSQIGNLLLYGNAGGLWKLDTTTDTIGAVSTSVGGGALLALDGVVLAVDNNQVSRSDGTAAGTFPLATLFNHPPIDMTTNLLVGRAGTRVIYFAFDIVTGPQMWGTDGFSVERLTDIPDPHIPRGEGFPAEPEFSYAGNLGGIGYFWALEKAGSPPSVWRTDGTAANTFRTSLPQGILVGDNHTVFFDGATNIGKYEPELDRVTPLTTGIQSYTGRDRDPIWFSFDNGQLYFRASEFTDPVHGAEPWVSDGTPAGTHILRDIKTLVASGNSSPDEFVEFGERLAFTADDGVTGRELWISDGTAAGTNLVELYPSWPGSDPRGLITLNGALYFFASLPPGPTYMRLASADSVPEKLAALDAPFFCGGKAAAIVGGTLYFAARDSSTGFDLWRTDGSPAGTRGVANLSPLGDGPCDLTASGNRLFFTVRGNQPTNTHGTVLYISDGTSAGTREVARIAEDSASSKPASLVAYDGGVYFAGDDATHGQELWKSDGTAAGTMLVADIVPGSQSSSATPVGMLNGKLLLQVSIPNSAQSSLPDVQLWTSDGTGDGTTRLGTFSVIPSVGVFINGDKAYFSVSDSSGAEPWVTDGAAAGTHLLTDINPSGDSNPTGFANFHSVTMFETNDPVRGRQLWRTDGTAAGTVLVGDMPKALPGGIAARRVAAGPNFYFAGAAPATGAELYVVANDAPTAGADSGTSSDGQSVAIDVLTNDTDSDGTLNSASLHVATAAAHGTVTGDSTGSLVYKPVAGFGGTDTFTYIVEDNQGRPSNAATVTVAVINPVPVPGGGSQSGGGHSRGGGALGIVELLMLLAMIAQARPLRR